MTMNRIQFQRGLLMPAFLNPRSVPKDNARQSRSKRDGFTYPTAWFIQHKLMEAMSERETHYTLTGPIQGDDAYFGGELSGAKAGRDSENKVPFVASLPLDDEGQPLCVKLTPVFGFTNKAIANEPRSDAWLQLADSNSHFG